MKIQRVKTDAAMAPRLTEIAVAAKKSWGYPDRWIEIWRDQLTITSRYIRDAHVVAALEGRQVAGFYALTWKPPRFHLDHLWIDPPRMNRGVDRSLLRHAAETAQALGGAELLVESDPNAEGFYKKMGGIRIGESKGYLEGNERFLPLVLIALDTSVSAA